MSVDADSVPTRTCASILPVVGSYSTNSQSSAVVSPESEKKQMSCPLLLVTDPPFATVAKYAYVPANSTGKSVLFAAPHLVWSMVIVRDPVKATGYFANVTSDAPRSTAKDCPDASVMLEP